MYLNKYIFKYKYYIYIYLQLCTYIDMFKYTCKHILCVCVCVCVYIYIYICIYINTHIFNCTWTFSGILSKICFTLRHKTNLSILHNTRYVVWKPRFEAKVLQWDISLQICQYVKIIQDIPKEPIFQRISHKGNYIILWHECKWKHF